MFDIIGKRRWFFLLSALITIPGLIFILLTPLSGGAAGLQFTIDYTGGTKWEIRFKDPDVTPDQVVAVFVANGLPASVVTTGNGFLEIKTEPIGLSAPAPSPTPVPTLALGAAPARPASVAPSASASAATSPSGSASPAASTSASASPSAAPTPSPTPSPSPSPAPSPEPGHRLGVARGLALRVARRRDRQHPAADRRQARRGGRGPREGAGPDRLPALADDDRRGRQLRPDHPGAHPDPRRVARDPALDHVPLPRREVRSDGPRRARPRRHRRRRDLRGPRARSSTSRSMPCS